MTVISQNVFSLLENNFEKELCCLLIASKHKGTGIKKKMKGQGRRKRKFYSLVVFCIMDNSYLGFTGNDQICFILYSFCFATQKQTTTTNKQQEAKEVEQRRWKAVMLQ